MITAALFALSFSTVQVDASPIALLEERYRASEKVAATYRPGRDELRDSKRLFGISDFAAAHQEYLGLLAKYPQSPEILVDYILFLDRSRKTALALEAAQQAVQKFPDQVRLLIIRDAMNLIARESGRKERAKHRNGRSFGSLESSGRLPSLTRLLKAFRRAAQKPTLEYFTQV
jgi:hypothetical protein